MTCVTGTAIDCGPLGSDEKILTDYTSVENSADEQQEGNDVKGPKNVQRKAFNDNVAVLFKLQVRHT